MSKFGATSQVDGTERYTQVNFLSNLSCRVLSSDLMLSRLKLNFTYVLGTHSTTIMGFTAFAKRPSEEMQP
jgi:hypothetical protein